MKTLTDDKHTKQCLGHLIFSMFQINIFHAFFTRKIQLHILLNIQNYVRAVPIQLAPSK